MESSNVPQIGWIVCLQVAWSDPLRRRTDKVEVRFVESCSGRRRRTRPPNQQTFVFRNGKPFYCRRSVVIVSPKVDLLHPTARAILLIKFTLTTDCHYRYTISHSGGQSWPSILHIMHRERETANRPRGNRTRKRGRTTEMEETNEETPFFISSHMYQSAGLMGEHGGC